MNNSIPNLRSRLQFAHRWIALKRTNRSKTFPKSRELISQFQKFGFRGYYLSNDSEPSHEWIVTSAVLKCRQGSYLTHQRRERPILQYVRSFFRQLAVIFNVVIYCWSDYFPHATNFSESRPSAGITHWEHMGCLQCIFLEFSTPLALFPLFNLFQLCFWGFTFEWSL